MNERWRITQDVAGWLGTCKTCGFEAMWSTKPPQESDECPECSKPISPAYTLEQIEPHLRPLLAQFGLPEYSQKWILDNLKRHLAEGGRMG